MVLKTLRTSLIPAYFLFFLLGLALSSSGQEYVFRSFRQAQGLNNLAITALTTDNQGFLWVGTQNGLYRYLGSSFQRFGQEQGLSEKNITGVLAAPDGTIWAGTDKNLYRWTGMAFQPAASRPVPIDTAGAFTVEAPGRLLIIVGNQLERLSYHADGSFSSLEPLFSNRSTVGKPNLEEIKLIKVAPDRTLWMGCGYLLCRWKNGVLQQWGKQQGIPEETHNTMAFDPKGSVWIVGERHILELPLGAGTFVDRTPPGFDLYHNFFEVAIAVDRLGRVVISTAKGLERWNGTFWQAFDAAKGIEAGSINPLLFDAAGDLWMGTFGGGVRQWVGYENWEGWSDHQALPSSSIWSINPLDPGRVVVGTENGPASINLHSGLVETNLLDKKWKYGPVSSITIAPNGDTLFATVNGDLLRQEASSRRVVEVVRLKTFIFKIFRDPLDQMFLLDYRHGILRLTDSSSNSPPTEIPEVKSLLGTVTPVYKACSTAGNVDWFSNRAGILEFAHNQWRRVPIDGFAQTKPLLRGLTCARDGSLWVSGKESGIWHLIPTNGRLSATELTLPKAQRSLSILDIFSDSRGFLWLGTDDGLLVWNGSVWRHLTQEVGLIWNDLNQFNLAEGSDGSLWIGTSGGVAHLVHPEQVFAATSPRIAIVEIRRGGEPLPASSTLRIPWAQRDLSLQFAATSTLNRDDLLFRYRIAGLQTAWTETKDTTAHFPSLPPGDYTFEAYARDETSAAQSPVLAIQLHVLPPWWRTVWAYLVYAFFTALAVAMLFRLRMSHLLVQKQRLETLVAERTEQLEASRQELHIQATHDGLTGLLNRIAILSALDSEVLRAQREKLALTLVMADIDHFKKVNDTHGHLAGDEALRRFSSALSQSICPSDHAGRYGGEEFMLVLTGITSTTIQNRLATLHASITNIPVNENKTQFLITCSFGAVCLDTSHQAMDRMSILAAADEALYEAKHAGRNRIVLRDFTPK